ncbi:MAG: hypothetical protein JW751_30805 [Polyangiaceae bacterium]|nr:hypothetical protein [Polyangiaceae bacterium]
MVSGQWWVVSGGDVPGAIANVRAEPGAADAATGAITNPPAVPGARGERQRGSTEPEAGSQRREPAVGVVEIAPSGWGCED